MVFKFKNYNFKGYSKRISYLCKKLKINNNYKL